MKKLTFIICCCIFQLSFSQQKILFITSNQHTYGNTKINTANHFEEIVLAYDVFKKAGYNIDIVSPKGGAIPIGYIKTSNPIQKKYLYDEYFMNVLEHTKNVNEINENDYVAVYYSGGGSAMFGVPQNKTIQKIVSRIYNKNGIISAVCHGTAGIADIKNKQGNYIFKNRKITGFPDAFERKDGAYFKTFPFSIEEKVKLNGGIFEYSKKGWDGFYLVDGRLVTGQDPTSSALVAKKVVELIKSK